MPGPARDLSCLELFTFLWPVVRPSRRELNSCSIACAVAIQTILPVTSLLLSCIFVVPQLRLFGYNHYIYDSTTQYNLNPSNSRFKKKTKSTLNYGNSGEDISKTAALRARSPNGSRYRRKTFRRYRLLKREIDETVELLEIPNNFSRVA